MNKLILTFSQIHSIFLTNGVSTVKTKTFIILEIELSQPKI